ncbi:phage replication protein O [Pseudomonas sp. LAMO17WK12:I10]|uniref:replication protein n=1 Tax=unclassified Pseudomonas TaxID=196821 RepID=UPI000BD9E14C|nr:MULTISPECIES: replication protein [unclassified Pseudomonas]PXX60707.1 phage replication protein O [Pseudomonas sp. LAMO17WK12:I9]SNY45465.1 phage replication protein O [Pseudomonas sp. LAMO17WK12:I10]
MSNVIPLRNTGGFTRMDNDLYKALIRADLSGRELRVALAIHKLTAGFNKEAVKVAALYISKMMYEDEEKAVSERANVSRAINSLIRQRVLFRDGGSRDPITFLPANEWKIDPKSTVLKSTHCVENTSSTVSKITHIKDINTNTNPNGLVVVAAASTDDDLESEPEQQGTQEPVQPAPAKADRIPYSKIQEIYNAVCGEILPKCLKLSAKRKTLIKGCWNLEINGVHPFRKGEFWTAYFTDCLTNKHWTGDNDRGWTADIEFLTRQDKVLKVLEAL